MTHLPWAGLKPEGDVILCDVARQEVSLVIDDLRALRITEEGSIAIEMTDTEAKLGRDRHRRPTLFRTAGKRPLLR